MGTLKEFLFKYKKAYEELSSFGVKFGKYSAFYEGKPNGKRNSIKQIDVKHFPSSLEELKNWLSEGFFRSFKEIANLSYYPYKTIEKIGKKRLPTYNLICDFSESNIIVFDCDVKNGKDGILLFRELFIDAFRYAGKQIEWDKYIRSVIKTPSGGQHIYFRQNPPSAEFIIRGKTDLASFTPYGGIEVIGQGAGIMFYGSSFKKKLKKKGKEQWFVYDYVGIYQVLKWESIPEFPQEVLQYLIHLSEENKKQQSRQNKPTNGGLKINTEKLYSKFYTSDEKIPAGQRFFYAQSLAGYLSKSSNSVEEALSEFERLLREKTDPDYTQEPEYLHLRKWIENNWEPPKHRTLKDKVKQAQQKLLEIGWRFLFNENKKVYEVYLPEEEELYDLQKNKEDLKELAELELDELGVKLAKTQINKIFIYNKKELFKPYHPFKEFFQKYEEVPSEEPLQKLFFQIVNEDFYLKNYTEETLYEIYTLFKKWLIMLYKSVYNESYNQVMLILRGEQQIGKTYLFKYLFPLEDKVMTLFGMPLSERKADFETALIERMLIVFDDSIPHFKEADWNLLKSVTSKEYHDFRRLHTNEIKQIRLSCSFAGTTNEFEFLHDFENKRFFVLEIKKYDRDELPNLAQIWGSVKYLSQKEKSYWTPDELNFINNLANVYRIRHGIDLLISDHFEILRVKNKRELDNLKMPPPYMIVFINSATLLDFFKKERNQYNITARELSKFFKREKYEFVSYGIPKVGPRKGYFAKVLSTPAQNFFEVSRPELIVENTNLTGGFEF